MILRCSPCLEYLRDLSIVRALQHLCGMILIQKSFLCLQIWPLLCTLGAACSNDNTVLFARVESILICIYALRVLLFVAQTSERFDYLLSRLVRLCF